MNRLLFLFAGGKTGGHLYPAIAIGQKILEIKPDAELHFVGTPQGIEARVIPELGYPLHLIAVRGFARGRILANLSVPFRLAWSLVQCARLVRRLKPAAVIGTGGFVSGPMLFMAHLFGYPTLIQEQNSYPGVTTRLLAKVVDRVHLSFAESKKYFRQQDKLVVTGNPVRKMHKTKKEVARKQFSLASDKPTLLVFGGSQGALVINRAILSILDRLMTKTEIQIIWSCGKWNFDEVTRATARYPGRVWVVDFIMDMPMAYSAADVVVSRAGALALAEISLSSLAAILIPFAAAAANHQQVNAMTMQNLGAAIVILEQDLQPERLAQEIIALFEDDERRESMQKAARQAAFADAGDTLARSVLSLVS
ncbi:undecaprenyldiphospho-muramoylpentapeptide beta-N-acetylglucosaminyltransferase [candidate division KSB1 bacterium]|nr:undecaprenyldiphospho-muramoylpentapeptide beta-N-acetylglucosaminyltransferase [candidate division KSB1 bacterium]